MTGDWYRTKAGVLVQEGRRHVEPGGVIRIDAYRVTGGRHGWLRLDALRRATAPKTARR